MYFTVTSKTEEKGDPLYYDLKCDLRNAKNGFSLIVEDGADDSNEFSEEQKKGISKDRIT